MSRIPAAQACADVCRVIREKVGDFSPEIGVVLGSGLGNFASRIEVVAQLAYADIPHFQPCHVEGHSGNLILGRIGKRRIICQQGRYHYYEGHDPQDIVLPIRVMSQMGAKSLLVSNAAGGINEGFEAGDVMLIRDHINFMGMNPLRGINADVFGARFPDMTFAYNRELGELMLNVARENSIFMREGVYLAVSGPSYETPAEINMFRTLGADAVGMSTVPEVIAANHAGMRVVGLSCIANAAAGMDNVVLQHEDVNEVVGKASKQFEELVEQWIQTVP